MTDAGGRRGLLLPALALAGLFVVAGALWLVPDVVARLRGLGVHAAAPADCHLEDSVCTAVFDDGTRVSLSVSPAGLPTETPLTFQVQVDPPGPEPLAVELQGLDMNMGLLRFPIDAQGRATGVVPVCTTERMRWHADVVLADRTAAFGFEATKAAPLPDATYGDFTLQGAEGPVSLSDFAGKAVVVYFGYTSCPDICPTTLQTVAAAHASLTPEEQARTALLMVSLDPERDSPEHLATYTAFYDPSFRGVTGTPEQVAKLAARWGVAWRRVDAPGSAMGYTLDHDTRAFLVAPDGHVAGFVRHGTSAQSVARQLRSLL